MRGTALETPEACTGIALGRPPQAARMLPRHVTSGHRRSESDRQRNPYALEQQMEDDVVEVDIEAGVAEEAHHSTGGLAAQRDRHQTQYREGMRHAVDRRDIDT